MVGISWKTTMALSQRQTSTRAGEFALQGGGGAAYEAFIPRPLPPAPPLALTNELLKQLSQADRALSKLNGLVNYVPNPNFFVLAFSRTEAVLSSQIEGTQATLEDVYDFEAQGPRKTRPVSSDTTETVNYILALNKGMLLLEQMPVCLRLIKEIHRVLLNEVRGEEHRPGEFREKQNWIGAEKCSVDEATFVTPPPSQMMESLYKLEEYIHAENEYPPLIHNALVHAQFETIHPFGDGNGRIGRLLITLLLASQGVLDRPLLYLSFYFKAHRLEYYDRLNAIRFDGDWEGWVLFFLRGVEEVSKKANELARKIIEATDGHKTMVRDLPKGPAFLEYLFENPYVNVNDVSKNLSIHYTTANKLLASFEELGILHEYTGQVRNRKFRYKAFLDTLRAGTGA